MLPGTCLFVQGHQESSTHDAVSRSLQVLGSIKISDMILSG